jgi:hypothetical protein
MYTLCKGRQDGTTMQASDWDASDGCLRSLTAPYHSLGSLTSAYSRHVYPLYTLCGPTKKGGVYTPAQKMSRIWLIYRAGGYFFSRSTPLKKGEGGSEEEKVWGAEGKEDRRGAEGAHWNHF